MLVFHIKKIGNDLMVSNLITDSILPLIFMWCFCFCLELFSYCFLCDVTKDIVFLMMYLDLSVCFMRFSTNQSVNMISTVFFKDEHLI